MLGDIPGLRMVDDPAYGTTNYQSCWIALPDDFPVTRDQLMAELAAHGIGARRGIMAAHREPAYSDHLHDDLPVTNWLTEHTLILPLYHQMTDEEQDRVVERLHRAVGR
jgi:perosamine synthetase